MINKRLTFDVSKQEDLIEKIRDFSKKRDYLLFEQIEGATHHFDIYDQEMKSGALVDIWGMFMGNAFIQDRIRIRTKISHAGEILYVTVNGDVMMNAYNYVNNRPKKRDALRCKATFEAFINEISRIDING
jgi:hypothetical protein